jgi:O-antigen/teichoic acid export membrane protein
MRRPRPLGSPAAKGVSARARSLAGTKLFKDTSWSMVAEFAGLISQTLTLLLIARQFGADLYGVFASTVALMHMLSPFTTVGMGYVMMQRVAGEHHDAGREAGRAWTTVALGGAIGTLVVLAVSHILLPEVPLEVVLLIAIGELIFTQITFTGRFCAQAVDRPATGAQVVATVWGMRLFAAIAFVVGVPNPTLRLWAVFHASISFLGAVATVVVLRRVLGWEPHTLLARREDVKPGLGYSLTVGAGYLKNDADKTLLLTFKQTTAAGIYNVAYRVINPLYIPIRALADSTFARFFREGGRSAADATKLAKRMTLIGAGITFAGGLAVFVCAPILPYILGQSFEESITVARWLAFVPFLVSFQMYSFNALIALGRQRPCVVITIITSLLNIVLNLLLIPHHSWRGATVATIVSEILAAVSLWVILLRVAAGEQRARADELSPAISPAD